MLPPEEKRGIFELNLLLFVPKTAVVLTTAQEIAAQEIATGASQVAAAKTAKVADRTVRSWMKKPEFVNQIRAIRQQNFEACVGLAATASTAVMLRLLNIVNQTENDATAVSAARLILSTASEAVNLDLLRKLEELEALNEETQSDANCIEIEAQSD